MTIKIQTTLKIETADRNTCLVSPAKIGDRSKRRLTEEW